MIRLLPFLLFIAIPILELALLIKVGQIIGVAATILLVIFTAVIGVALLKRQGLAVMRRAQSAVEAGELPVDSVVDGACLLVAGAFLLTPGLITDTAGFLLLIPQFRIRLAHAILERMMKSGRVHVYTSRGGPRGPSGPGDGRSGGRGPVIEGEFEEVGDKSSEGKTPPRQKEGPSPWRK